MNRLYIGVDIGGTSIVAARFSESELLANMKSTPGLKGR